MNEISNVWPKWQIVSVLGEGGFGKVYKAKRDDFGEVYYSAIKVVKIPSNQAEVNEMTTSGLTKDHIKSYYRQSVVSLVDEIKMMTKFKSASHIVSIEDFEVVENTEGIGWTIYIRMELLQNVLDYFKEYPVTNDEVVKVANHILSALVFCHDQNIIHRDIKPGNIFISEFGEYKLGDFGISREVEKTNATLSQKGTKSYMAPEMIRLESYNKTVDLYALGLTMYELLNHGRMPFLPSFPEPFYPQDREEATLKRLTGEVFPEIDGIGELNQIIQKACHFDPQQRYQSATEMKEALQNMNQTINLSFDDFGFEEEKTVSREFVEENTQILGNDEKTMSMFDNSFLFDEKKPEHTNIDSTITIEMIENYIIEMFKKENNIDLSKDVLAKSRIHEAAIDAQSKLSSTSDSYLVDIPYIAVTQQGPAHLKMNIRKEDLVRQEKEIPTWLTEDTIEVNEPNTIKCPHCGNTAYKVFTHGYHCNSEGCYKVTLTQNTSIDTKRRDAYIKQNKQTDNPSLKLQYALELVDLDANCGQAYVYAAVAYNQLKNQAKRLEYLNKAYQLDNKDAASANRLCVYYLDNREYSKALEYSKKALKALEARTSSMMTPSNIYGNHAISLQKNGQSEIAFAYLKKAYDKGYNTAQLRDTALGWKIAWEYIEKVVREAFEKRKISSTCRSDQNSLQQAITDLVIDKRVEPLYVVGPTSGFMSGNKIKAFNLAFTKSDIYYKDQDGKNWYLSYYCFDRWTFKAEGEYVILVTGNVKYQVNVGKDAKVIADILNELKSVVLAAETNDEPDEPYTIKCPHCGNTAYKVFSHGYHCISKGCYKVTLTQNTSIDTKRRDAYIKQNEQTDNPSLKLQYALELVDLDSDCGQAYVYAAVAYNQLKNQAKRLEYLNKAYQLDNKDAASANRLCVYYLDNREYSKALEYSKKALEALEARTSSMMTPSNIYGNHAISLQKNGQSEIAFAYLKKAYDKGYNTAQLRDTALGWKIGWEYIEKVLREAFRKHKVSSNCRSDQNSLQQAITDLVIDKRVEPLYVVGPTSGFMSGNKIKAFNLAFTKSDIYYKDQDGKNWYLSYYCFDRWNFKAEGEHVVLTSGNLRYQVSVGKEAKAIANILNELKAVSREKSK